MLQLSILSKPAPASTVRLGLVIKTCKAWQIDVGGESEKRVFTCEKRQDLLASLMRNTPARASVLQY